MRFLLTPKLAIIMILQAAGVGFASPSVIVVPTLIGFPINEWLPKDNQTMYHLRDSEIRWLELNRTERHLVSLSVTVSPCTSNVVWAVYHSYRNQSNEVIQLVNEFRTGETATYTTMVTKNDRYIIELRSKVGQASAAVWARSESSKGVKLRLRRARRRRLSASWDPSPLDPQATTYCIVASAKREYTSLCAARLDLRKENIADPYDYDVFRGNRKTFRKRKFSRSTKAANEDPIIICVGDRTHHTIDNLDNSKTYNIAVFGIGPGRLAGELQAYGKIEPKLTKAISLNNGTSTNIELKQGAMKSFIKYSVSASNQGIWMAALTCGGTVNLEISSRGKILKVVKNIGPYDKFYVTAPTSNSYQDSYEASAVISSSSSYEESEHINYLIKIIANYRESDKYAINVELIVSEERWSLPLPERVDSDVVELRPYRECTSITVAFLPALHPTSKSIRYCVIAEEVNSLTGATSVCPSKNGAHDHSVHCMEVESSNSSKPSVIRQRIGGLKSGSRYAVRVTAAITSNSTLSVPYKLLYANTDHNCD